MPASQAHGFTWERDLLTKVYQAPESELATLSYTAKNDLPAAMNRRDPGVAVSVKTSGNPKSVDMGSALRIFDAVSSGEKLHMTVIFYAQEDTTTKRIREIIEVDITDAREPLFGSLGRSDVEALDAVVRAVPQKRSPTAEEHAAIYSLQPALNKRAGAIQLRPKCDSQQSRLQCSFNHFDTFLATHPTRVIHRGIAADFRGASIQETISSTRRVRHLTAGQQSGAAE